MDKCAACLFSVLAVVVSGAPAWGQAQSKQNQVEPPAQIQKPAVQQLQIQQLPSQAPQGAVPKPAGEQDGELLLTPLPAGWKQGTVDQQFNLRTTQFFPDGQTVQKWEEMLRTRIFYFVREAPLENFLMQAASIPKERCDDVILTPVAKGVVNGYPSVFSVRLCTRDKQSGEGEVDMIKVIQGKDSLYIGERAWRVKPFSKDKPPVAKEKFDQWVKFMSAFAVCDTRDPARPCPRPPAKK